MLLDLLFCAIGLVLLTYAADAFVEGAARLSVALNVSPIVIGAVVIGFGTSAPEMLVSGLAAFDDKLDVGVGNVVGSNIANLSLVLAAAALVTPVVVASSVLRREAILSGASVIVFGYFLQNGLTRIEGVTLLVLLAAALTFIIVGGEGGGHLTDDVEEFTDSDTSVGTEIVRTIVGLVGTIIGAQLLVSGATGIASSAGLSEGFVGATLIALGTSLPELVTSVTAARKGETDLIIGNLLGSNLFNSFAVGGLIAVIGPGQVTDTTMQTLGAAMMIGACLLAIAFMATGAKVVRNEAMILLVLYVFTVVALASSPPEDEAEAGPAPVHLGELASTA